MKNTCAPHIICINYNNESFDQSNFCMVCRPWLRSGISQKHNVFVCACVCGGGVCVCAYIKQSSKDFLSATAALLGGGKGSAIYIQHIEWGYWFCMQLLPSDPETHLQRLKDTVTLIQPWHIAYNGGRGRTPKSDLDTHLQKWQENITQIWPWHTSAEVERDGHPHLTLTHIHRGRSRWSS